MAFLGLIFVPIIILVIVKLIYKHDVTLLEFGIQFGLSILIAAMSVGIIYFSNTSDIEIWNGHVTNKSRDKVSCEHDYCCSYGQCCSGSGKDRSCYTCCKSTCYEHSYDFDYNVKSNIGRTQIDRVDRQGVKIPPRFTKVIVGEPFSRTNTYTNYIKAAPHSLFKLETIDPALLNKVVKYPDKTFDYYRHNKFIAVGYVTNTTVWSYQLAEISKRISPSKQVNPLVVIIKNQPVDIFYAYKQKWIGGKKNDAILFIGTDNTNKPLWVKSMSWSKTSLYDITIEDLVSQIDYISPETVLPIFEDTIVQHFVRRPMKDFEYLKTSIAPTPTQFTIALIINIILSIGISVLMIMNERPARYYR